MRFSLSTIACPLFLLAASVFPAASAENTCSPDPLEFSTSIGMKVEKVGAVPTNNTGAWSYNMMPADNFDDALFFMDQSEGMIYSYDDSDSSVTKVFDMATSDLPAGITLDWTYGGAGQTFKVHAMSQGKTSDEVYVVFMSSTLPTGWTKADATLPPEDAYPGYACNGTVFFKDLYRIGLLPDCFNSGAGLTTFTAYEIFTKFTLANGKLTNPKAFFVSEMQVSPGHMGGGIVTVDDKGKILWGVGDCLPFGTDGRYAPQLNREICGKIILIDPETQSYDVVAKGVRNSQQFRVFNKKDKYPKLTNARDTLAFMDIGGVTAEEVNAKWLSKICDTKKVDNFGWGRSIVDGKAREGTFYVQPGILGYLGSEPPCDSAAPSPEKGYNQPWIQFGRTATDYFYAISSFAIAYKSFDELELIWSEFNTGYIMGTPNKFKGGYDSNLGVAKGYKLKLYDADGKYLENGCNDLVKEELGEVGYYRGDPRLFHYPDGTAGVFIERTGVFYRLTEIATTL
mmetsp:Transcript_2751/g.4151  ORF Transcript_2751/g.4151 Transcript_2751/m.4151 type:complete len:512 (+) Transcript_2751:73-1608(+)|eukprot:CAMPEP_0197247524 /NCGR_PEP_ID=MMETSP1429-20130617/29245_1 /TAXON_ID=49237 /ORGANISM="Chaetoceros  sp., Strain UNC1202" /LENGTH=511 /DNA_ID=CAMNT_0042708443 /DNA_START=73 /DNA_END=1608 /DNA_ORIENTATION=+